MMSHGRRDRANSTTCGVRSPEESRVPRETVMYPGMPEFLPNSGLPHVLQKTRVTLFPLSAGIE